MARGGVRENAGRKAGIPNKANAERAAAIEASGETPRDYMLRVMRDPSVDHDRRDRMAVAVSPYVHPKLTATEHTGKDGKDLIPADAMAPADFATRLIFILEKAAREKAAPDKDASHG